MNAIVDELRIWNKTYTQNTLRAVIQAPLANPESETNLVLYYDFNQSSGNVIDKSAKKLTGVRSNFGPDGDAWTNSKGIFFLNFTTASSTDVTSKYTRRAAP